MQLFYTQQITAQAAAFDETESAHAIQVLRLKTGDLINFTDGLGKLYKGVVELVGKKQFIANKIELIKSENEPPTKIHLYVSPTKMSDRFEWLVEKATELGVSSITPLLTERTIKKNQNTKRLKNLALSGMKQSLQLFLPVIYEPQPLTKINFTLQNSNYFFGYCGEMEKQNLKDIALSSSNVHFFIGPEGDFTPKEIELMQKSNCAPVTFGETRLRTETAAIYVSAILKFRTT
jgi:16S rRNA (uracil1498-N3)-methyltransferase